MAKGGGGLRAALIFFDVVLFAAILLLPLAWFFDPLHVENGPVKLQVSWGFKPVLITIALLVIRILIKHRGLRGNAEFRGPADCPVYRKLSMLILAPLAMLLALEGAAALAGVDLVDAAPIVIQDDKGLQPKVEKGVVKDPELLYTFAPDQDWDGYRINSHGYRTWEFSAEKPENTMRIISLGDSCTAQGRPPYSDRLNKTLKSEPPTPMNWESFNMGVYGFSIMQGHRQFVRDGVKYKPDVVTIYYGWNDHWVRDKPDHLRMAKPLPPLQAKIVEGIQKKRIYAALAKVLGKYSLDRGSDNKVYRVPLPMYRETLASLIDEVRSVGAVPIVITAPRRHLQSSVVSSGHARSVEEAEAIHDVYVEATREVAHETGAEMIDLYEILSAEEFDRYFMDDGIHLKGSGLSAVSRAIYSKLVELFAQPEPAGTEG